MDSSMKKLILLLFLIPHLVMGENLSLVCKGERDISGGGLVSSIEPDTRTYILEDEKL